MVTTGTPGDERHTSAVKHTPAMWRSSAVRISSNFRRPDSGHSRYGINAALNSLATPVTLSVSKCSDNKQSPPRCSRADSSALIARSRYRPVPRHVMMTLGSRAVRPERTTPLARRPWSPCSSWNDPLTCRSTTPCSVLWESAHGACGRRCTVYIPPSDSEPGDTASVTSPWSKGAKDIRARPHVSMIVSQGPTLAHMRRAHAAAAVRSTPAA